MEEEVREGEWKKAEKSGFSEKSKCREEEIDVRFFFKRNCSRAKKEMNNLKHWK
jgi:hypothetical protein